MKLLTALLAVLAIAGVTGCGTTTPPAAKPALQVSTEIKSLLWVGNSFFYYNNSMHGHVGRLLTDSGAKGMRASSLTISGSGINWHDIDAYFNKGMASYSFVGDNEVRFNSFDKPFDGVMMMTNGNLRFSEAQKRNLLDFVRSGKGFIGAHCASLTFYDYPEFGDMLGGYFQRNLPQGTIAVLKVEDGKHPATRMLGAGWPLVDEFYLFGTAPWDAAKPNDNVDSLFKNKIPMGFSRDRVHVLLSLDTERMDLSKQPHLVRGGDYPQAWTRTYGKGRSFYTSLGHRDDIWSSDPVFRAHIAGGIRWALGLEQ
mgnify:CR=1 FL=1